jgi:glycine dehydrogenase subunit 1
MSLLGKQGFVAVAEHCFAKARYLREAVLGLRGYTPGFDEAPYFNEFALRVRGGNAAEVVERLEASGIVAGYDLGRADPKLSDRLLIAVTENHRREDLDRLVRALDAV